MNLKKNLKWKKIYPHRDEYEVELNKLNLHVHFSDWYTVSGGALQPRDYQTSCLPLTLDRRQNVTDLRIAVMEVTWKFDSSQG